MICCKKGFIWVVKRATSLFNTFCSNDKLHVFCCPFNEPQLCLLIKKKHFFHRPMLVGFQQSNAIQKCNKWYIWRKGKEKVRR